MSTEVALFNGKLPAHLRNQEIDEVTKALAGGSGASHRRISIEGGVFRMIVNGEQMAENEDRAMNIVIVAAAPSVNRQYYAGTYVKGKSTPPTCWSPDGKTPSPEAEQPQSKSCDTCKQNIAGSGQGDSRACRYQQRLAVVLEGEMDGPVYQLALPATSLFGKGEANATKLPLQAYARYLAQNGVSVSQVVTEMRFDTKAATPKLTFKATRPLDIDEVATVKDQGSTMEAQQAIKLTVSKMDKKAAEAEEEAEEEEVEEVEENVAEPVKVAPRKPVASPDKKRSAAAVVAQWEDE